MSTTTTTVREPRKIDREALRLAAASMPVGLRALSGVRKGMAYGHLADDGRLTYRMAQADALAVGDAADALSFDDANRTHKKSQPKPWKLTVTRTSKGVTETISETELNGPAAGVKKLTDMARTFGMGVKAKHIDALKEGKDVKLPGGLTLTLTRVAPDVEALTPDEWADSREDAASEVYEAASVTKGRAKDAKKAAKAAAKAAREAAASK